MKRFIAVLCLVAVTGCHTTRHTAITSDREADACQRACPNTGSQESFLSCLRSCPDTTVFDDQECRDTPLGQGQRCVQMKTDEFSAKRTLLLIGGIVTGVVAGGAVLIQEARWGGL